MACGLPSASRCRRKVCAPITAHPNQPERASVRFRESIHATIPISSKPRASAKIPNYRPVFVVTYFTQPSRTRHISMAPLAPFWGRGVGGEGAGLGGLGKSPGLWPISSSLRFSHEVAAALSRGCEPAE